MSRLISMRPSVIIQPAALILTICIMDRYIINHHHQHALIQYCYGISDMSSFMEDFYVSSGAPADHVRLHNDASGRVLQLLLDKSSASGFASKRKYLFGSINMRIKLVPGNSAGTVTTYYLASETSHHDELDFEFLGNLSGEPYILQTNVFANGVGGREQRIYLWFDPSKAYHTYSFLWNKEHIIFFVDGTPIRKFDNKEIVGLPYLNKQAMRVFASLWNGESWATRGGLVKLDWKEAPFIASFASYTLDACTVDDGVHNLDNDHMLTYPCPSQKTWWNQPNYYFLDTQQQKKLKWVQEKFMIYNYCNDTKRNPIMPLECKD